MKIRKLKFILLSFIVFSCTSKHETTENYDSGNPWMSKSYDADNTLVSQTYYYDLPGNKKYSTEFKNHGYDSLVYYYDNGRIHSTGKNDGKGRNFGKWYRYNRDGLLSEVQEFFIIKEESLLNQIWYLNRKKDTLYLPSDKFNVYKQKEFKPDSSDLRRSIFVRFGYTPSGDTLSIANPLRAIAYDNFPLFGNASVCYLVLAKEKYNFNKDFSNEKVVKLDTFVCLERDKLNKENYPLMEKKHSVAFGRWFDTPGKKILRGYMVEYITRKPTVEDSMVKRERRTYFEKTIYVKDTVK